MAVRTGRTESAVQVAPIGGMDLELPGTGFDASRSDGFTYSGFFGVGQKIPSKQHLFCRRFPKPFAMGWSDLRKMMHEPIPKGLEHE